MLSKLRRLADLTFIEQTLLLQLAPLSFALRILLTTMALPRLVALLSRAATWPLLGRIPLFHARCPIDRLLMLIDTATAMSHGDARCLPRSLLLFWLLRTRQQPVSVCLGLSTNRNLLEGHAWVEQSGVVLGDTLSFTNRYAVFVRLPR
jgi:hypothetical protein